MGRKYFACINGVVAFVDANSEREGKGGGATIADVTYGKRVEEVVKGGGEKSVQGRIQKHEKKKRSFYPLSSSV